MPIYEFYCRDCHRLFNFLSRKIDPAGRPACPKCGRPELERRASAFAISKGLSEPSADGMPDVDEGKMERLMAELAGKAEGMDENDPRQVAGMMRRLFEATGMKPGGSIAEAIRRMEAGEDPEKIDEEMGHLFDEEDPFLAGEAGDLKGLRRKILPPSVDEKLYEM